MIQSSIRFPDRLIVLLLAFSLLIAACGGGESEPTSAPVEDSGAAQPTVETASEGSESEDAFEPQQFSVNQEFWHSGFRVELSDGSYYIEENTLTGAVRYYVSITASFENLGDNQTFFYADAAIVWDGDSAPHLLSSDFPDVPSGLASKGEFIFEVDENFDATSAHLLIGSGGDNRAQVPLGPEGGDLIALEPTEPSIEGSISLELIDLTFHSAELRADRPMSYTEVEDGKLALTLKFDATSRNQGNWNVYAQDFALILPSGSAVGPDGSELESLPGSESGVVTSDLSIRFLVDNPASGEYTLRFTAGSWFIGSDEVAEGTFDFVIE
jgi:hypothetical protein